MRRRRFRSSFNPGLILLLALGALVVARYWQDAHPASETPPAAMAEGVFHIDRVVDGDTLLLTNHARIRLIGVDAPETVRPGLPRRSLGPGGGRFYPGLRRGRHRAIAVR